MSCNRQVSTGPILPGFIPRYACTSGDEEAATAPPEGAAPRVRGRLRRPRRPGGRGRRGGDRAEEGEAREGGCAQVCGREARRSRVANGAAAVLGPGRETGAPVRAVHHHLPLPGAVEGLVH